MSNALRLTPADRPIEASLRLAGSKSYTNRALLIAALTTGKSVLHWASPSADSELMCAALNQLGIHVDSPTENTIIVDRPAALPPFSGVIDIGPAGTTMRFLTALCASLPGVDVRLQGSERMHQRPIADLVDALRSLGADISYEGASGCAPLKVRGRTLAVPEVVEVHANQSSQFLSAVLMLAPSLGRPVHIKVPGEFVSRSYVEMTIDSMRAFGAVVESKPSSFTVSGAYRPTVYEVEPDASGASYLWSFGALTGGCVQIEGLHAHSAQGDAQFPKLLEAMGCTIEHSPTGIAVRGSAKLQGIEADMDLMPDTAQTLAVVAAFASGNTVMTGLSTLKAKETDRLLALKTELARCGVESNITDDSIAVHGGTPHHGAVHTYEDHRMAMSFALLGARHPGVTICEPSVVAKSFPHFWKVVENFGIRTEPIDAP